MISPLQNSSIAFRGTVENSEETKQEKQPKIDISDKVDSFNKEAEEVTDSVAETTNVLTKLIGQIGTTAAGIWALLQTPVKKIVDFYTKTITPEVKNNAGEIVKEAVKKVDLKKLGITGAIVATGLAIFGVVTATKHKNESKVNQADVSSAKTQEIDKKETTTEETKELEETEELKEPEETEESEELKESKE